MVQEAKEKKGLLIRCHGQYYYKTDKAKGTKNYEMEVKAPSLAFFNERAEKYLGTDDNGKAKFAVREFLNIRGSLKKRLLPILLAKKDQEFARVKFTVIDEVISLSGEELDLPIVFRSKEQLRAFVRKERIPIDVDSYLEIDELRTDIVEYQTNPEVFLQFKAKKDVRRAEEKEFAEMNDLNEPLPPQIKPKAKGPQGSGIAEL